MSFWKGLFGGSPKPAPASDSRFAEIARTYDQNDARQRAAFLEAIHKSIYESRNDLDVLAYHASFACGIAATIRSHVGLDLGALAFPDAQLPLAQSQPMDQAMKVLDQVIEHFINWLGTAPADDPRRVDTNAKMQAAFIWKSYLLALRTSPSSWRPDESGAIGALAILSSADPVRVTGSLRDGTNGLMKNTFEPTTRNNVRDDDWPPRGFKALCAKHGDLIEKNYSKNFGVFGGVLMKRSEIDAVKEAANANTERARQALEQKPRATPAENAERAAGMRTIDDVKNVYSNIRRADFCDVIAMVVRAGTLSEDGDSFALHLREWVRSGGDTRRSFPEWLEEEGREHFLKLNSEWLNSGVDKRTTFNEWLAATGIEERSEMDDDGDGAPESVDTGKWSLQGSKLVRTYKFSGLPAPVKSAQLTMECSVSRYLNGVIGTNFGFTLRPYLFLMPSHQPLDPDQGLVTPPFSVGLMADGSGAGTEADPLIRGGVLTVDVCGLEEEPETVFLSVRSRNDVMLCVKAIATGEDMTFTIMDYDTEPPVKLRLRLPNDREFPRLYERIRSSV